MKEATSGAAKEMADKLAKMRAEREKQDTMWTLPTEVSTEKESLIPKVKPPS